MPNLARRLMLLLASLSTLPLGACSILTTEPTSISAAAVATSIGHVRPSKRDTCETQVQVAEQSTRIATYATGKETVYKPFCDPAKPDPKAAPAAAGPKTSGVEVDAEIARRVASAD